MPAKWYQIRVFKQRVEVNTASDLRERLDWADVDGTNQRLLQILRAAIDRDGARRNERHLYHLQIVELDSGGRPVDNRAVHYALPEED